MYNFLRQYQLDVMLIFVGICAMLVVFSAITRSLSPRRKFSLILMEVASMILLWADRYAYIYRGDISATGWWMVRISNYLVFTASLLVLFTFNLYLIDLCKNEGGIKKTPLRLYIVNFAFVLGEILIIISQFTGFYYTFDEYNCYQRASGYMLCYLIPLIIMILQFSVLINFRKKISRTVWTSMILFSSLPILATFIQIFAYGLSLTNMTVVLMVILFYTFALKDLNNRLERANHMEIEFLKKERENMRLMFEQTAGALANAIDAKDKYTHGHSMRVAEYSKKIAEIAGKSEKECDDIYFSALLHDVGKIGVPDTIINKEGKLTDEEFDAIKGHPVIGKQILSSISMSPNLSIGANYHHERYDGRGYPEGLKGDDIPQIARIIAVADAYDAMTSKRSYRDPIPQQKVREEILKGSGFQFDPAYAKIMLHLIDLDIYYQMKERTQLKELAGRNNLICTEYGKSASEGIRIAQNIIKIHLTSKAEEGFLSKKYIPSLIVFDSLDGRIHDSENEKKDLLFLEYANIRFDGEFECKEARKIKSDVISQTQTEVDWESEYKKGIDYDLEAVRVKDHLLLKIITKFNTRRIIVALTDNSRYSYFALTGEHCDIRNVKIETSDLSVDENYIPRIEEKISYIEGEKEGVIPNVEIDGWCTQWSEPILLKDGMKIKFHTKSFPTARLIWHCPYLSLYYASDGKRFGKDYKEFSLIRLDGEGWDMERRKDTETVVRYKDDFVGWEDWKAQNKNGFDSMFAIMRKGNKVIVKTENCGVSVTTTTLVEKSYPQIYAVLTGDQCAITNIRF